MKEALGLGLLAVGVIGCVIPLLPGIPLLLAGAALLGHEHKLVRPWLSKIKRSR